MAPIKALVVFRNRIHQELIRTVHVHQSEGGEEEVVEEREYVFRESIDYEEMRSPGKLFTVRKFDVSAHYPGLPNGVWDCIFVFDGRLNRPKVSLVPEELSISRNPKLVSIPSLANDLEMILQLGSNYECGDSSGNLTEESHDVGHVSGGTTRQVPPLLDLNSFPCAEGDQETNLPCAEGENQETNLTTLAGTAERKFKRAAAKHISRLGLEDLAKYFDVPIIEASKNLKVGLTVLKKKCREFGIPRWPHRKIKSLDGLIRDLQGEVERQREEDEVAASAVAKRQRMIESEKESIEKKPCLDINCETKKFRQDIFKRRHKARVYENQSRTLPLVQTMK